MSTVLQLELQLEMEMKQVRAVNIPHNCLLFKLCICDAVMILYRKTHNNSQGTLTTFRYSQYSL